MRCLEDIKEEMRYVVSIGYEYGWCIFIFECIYVYTYITLIHTIVHGDSWDIVQDSMVYIYIYIDI